MRKSITLLFDLVEERKVFEKVRPLFENHAVHCIPYHPSELPELEKGALVATYLDDACLATLLPEASRRGWVLGLLSHPGMTQACQSFGISRRLKESVEDFLESDEPVLIDLLLCNGRPVLSSVVLADVFTLSPGSASREGLWKRLLSRFALLRQLGSVNLLPFRITTEKGKILDTAAAGIIAVQHARSSLLTRRLLENTSIHDGMFHTLVISPRSIMEMVRFLVGSLFWKDSHSARLPSFVGHIKTESIAITGPAPLNFTQDGVLMSAREIDLAIVPKALQLIPGRHHNAEGTASEMKEVFNVRGLPTGVAKAELASKPLPWIHHATTEDFRELFQILRENAKPTPSYLILTMLSTLIATLGLFGDSAPVIIGAMILAPLMAPIISLSMGILRQDESLIRNSVQTLGLGLLLALGFATLLTLATPLYAINSEIAARIRPTLLDLGIAVFSGIAGAYAHAREEVAKSLAGVAIAVALVPPIAVSGIGIGWGDWAIFSGAMLLFLTNLAGMILAAALTFLILGYSPFRLARRGLFISFLLVVVVTVPLVFGFLRMVGEHRIVKALSGLQVEDITLREVSIRRIDPLHISVRLLSRHSIDDNDLERVKRAIEHRVGQTLVMEAVVALER